MELSKDIKDIKTRLVEIEYEDDLRINVIIPLMKALGAIKVEDRHGYQEKGIDVYFSYKNIFNKNKHCGIILKKGDIKKSYGNDMRNITNQIEEALRFRLKNPLEFTSDIRISEIYIINNGKINNPAREVIKTFFDTNIFTNFSIYDADILKNIIHEVLTKNRKYIPDPYVFEVDTFKDVCKMITKANETISSR